MVYFQTQNPNFGIIWRALEWIMLVCFKAIWNLLRQFGIFYALTYVLFYCDLVYIFFPVLVWGTKNRRYVTFLYLKVYML
jgi:hypothetical protein